MSGGGGKGSGSTSQTVSSPAANTLANIAEKFSTETTGLREGLINTMQEVLKTGGSSLPIISSAIEKSRQESSKAMKETDESLAQSGLAGTPFGEKIKSEQAQSGAQSVAQTRDALAQQIFSMISNFVLGQSQTSLGGLAGAIPGMSSTTGSEKAKGLGFSF